MPPALTPVDRQSTWFPTWVIESPAFPHLYALRDVSVPAVPGDGFIIGDSDVGGGDLVGGGSGPDALHAWGRITESPTITRRITDPFWPIVEVQDGSAKVAGLPSGDYRGQPITVSRYDGVSGLRLYEAQAIITRTVMDREGTVIEWTTVDRAILEEQVPKGVIDTTAFPQAAPEAIGKTIPWLFGNVTSLPLLCVRDDQVNSIFDYIVCRGTAAAITGLRRLTPTGADATVDIDFIELEPYPGMDGALVNGGLEDWDAGTAVAPDSWALTGAGATVAKNIVNVDEGGAAASWTRVGANAFLEQDLAANTPTLPLSWWQGREITLTTRQRGSVAATGDCLIVDSVGQTASGDHTGGGAYEQLSVTHTIDAASTSVAIKARIKTNNSTWQLDTVRVYLKAKSWTEVLRTDLYPGYTAVRFYLRQDDASGALYQIVADVNGLQPERNPVRAIRTLLSDATHSIDRTVDASSFDAAEIAACLTHKAAVLLDAPELFAPYTECLLDGFEQTVVIHDHSGHERHGAYDNGTGGPGTPVSMSIGNSASGTSLNDAYIDRSLNESWTEWPDDPAYSSQTPGLRITFKIRSGGLPDATQYPIMEKLVGTAFLSGYGLYRENNNLIGFVRGADTNLYLVASPLVDITDENRWIDVCLLAGSGVLSLYRDGVLASTAAYTGDIAEGYGKVLVAKFGIGSVQFGEDSYDNVTLYSSVVSAARIEALHAALPLDEEAIGDYGVGGVFSYQCDESSGDVTMADSSGNGHHGTWVGGPSLGTVEGPLNRQRGFCNSGSAVHFANNIAQYGVETGMTLADASASVTLFYKPSTLKAKAGIIEKTIGGVRGTQWGFCQLPGSGPTGIIRFTVVDASGTKTIDAPLLAEDVGRWMYLVGRWGAGSALIRLYKNGVATDLGGIAYSSPIASGVGDFYIGKQGTSGGVASRPAQGDIGRVEYTTAVLSTADVQDAWTRATWYNGGNLVDAALTEPRQLQDWLAQIGQLRGIRLGFTSTGAITCSVDTAPNSIFYDARDGAGDGERNIVAISGRQRPSLDDTVKDMVVKYRLDLVTGEWLGEIRRTVNASIGRDRVFECLAVREHFTADRFADYASKRMLAGEDSVEVTLHQEARRLNESNLVQITDALMDYSSNIMEVREVRKTLPTIGATITGWDEDTYTYEPEAFPSGATSG